MEAYQWTRPHLWQNKFIKLIQEEKKKGTNIYLMSSHLFWKIERRVIGVVIIKNGKIDATKTYKY